MVMAETYLLVISAVLSILAISLAVYWMKYEIVSGSNWIKLRAYGVILLAVGFIIHSIGDYLEGFYGESITLTVESFGHIIIFIGFFLFLYAAIELVKISKEYGFE